MLRFTATILLVSFVALAGCGDQQRGAMGRRTSYKQKTVITLQDLEEMFANMRAKTKWDVDGEMLWGYFFFDPDTNKLERVSQRLIASGYRLVQIYPTDDKSSCVLHVERVEKHTPQSLHARNGEFERLADEFNLECYDGMDVGPVMSK